MHKLYRRRHFVNVSNCARMLRIIKIVTSKTYVQKALILNGFFMLAQPPGERECTIVVSNISYEILSKLSYASPPSSLHTR